MAGGVRAPRRSLLNKTTNKEGLQYEGKDTVGAEATINENLVEWIQYIEMNGLSYPGMTTEFDIARSIQWLLFDMICRLCFGHPFGFISKHEDCYDFQKTLEERLPIVEIFAVVTEMSRILRFVSHVPLLKRVLPSAKDQSGIGKILGVRLRAPPQRWSSFSISWLTSEQLAQKAVEERFEPGFKPRNDILGSWLNKGVPRDQAESEMVIALYVLHAMDRCRIPAELLILFGRFAGSDTTATSVRATLLYIISNPLIYSRLHAEIDAAVAANTISPMVSDEEARKLPYLQACIREGIRIFPPITALRERVTPPEGDTFQGHFIPGGVNIGLNMRGLLQDEAFGPDAKVFRPERWLESDPKKMREMERVHELVFNWGFTRCLGIQLATSVASKFFVEVSFHSAKPLPTVTCIHLSFDILEAKLIC